MQAVVSLSVNDGEGHMLLSCHLEPCIQCIHMTVHTDSSSVSFSYLSPLCFLTFPVIIILSGIELYPLTE